MRMYLILLAACLANTACSKKQTTDTETVPYEVAIATIQKAQDDAERTHLNERLSVAGTNLGKLKHVYEDATRLNVTHVAAEADKRIATIVMPRVTAYRSPGVIRKYLKKVPEGSNTEKTLSQLLITHYPSGR